MKIFCITVLLLFISFLSFAQKALLVFNEQNRYTYYQVKNAPSAGNDTLTIQAAQFIKKNYPKIISNKATKANNITGTGNVVLFKGNATIGREEGAVCYKLSIDFKDRKYRLIFTDFIFTPYQRNRYGVFVPKSGVEMPLENNNNRLTKIQQSTYLDQIGAYCTAFDKQLAQHLANPAVQEKHGQDRQEVKRVSTKEW